MERIALLLAIIIAMIIEILIFAIFIKKLKKIVNNKKLNELSNKFPKNIDVCKSLLKALDNEKVKVKEKSENKDKTSLYIAVTDTILIADIKGMFTRIQTIAHECLHSIQNRGLLLCNFYLANIYRIYFIVISILTITGVIKNYNLQIIILIILGAIQYLIRSYLETDAMVKAQYLSVEYMKQYAKDNKVCSLDDIEQIEKQYERINRIGIPLYNFELLTKLMMEPCIYFAITVVTVLIRA